MEKNYDSKLNPSILNQVIIEGFLILFHPFKERVLYIGANIGQRKKETMIIVMEI